MKVRGDHLAFILIVPPPTTGMTVVSRGIEGVLGGGRYKFVLSKKSEHLWILRKYFFYISCFLRVMIFERKIGRVYFVSESGRGLWFTAAIVVAYSIIGVKVYLHHHVYSYINKKKLAMRVVAWLSVTHIFLSESMKKDFMENYDAAGAIDGLVFDNAFLFSDNSLGGADFPKVEDHEPLRVLYLSNITLEKGIDDFLCVAKSLGRENYLFTVAGPFGSADVEKMVMAAVDEGLVDYVGPVYGDEKKNIFSRNHVFVFPTKYENEAQPVVIYEAMRSGLLVLSYSRGAIPDQLSLGGLLCEDKNDFIEKLIWVKNNSKVVNEMRAHLIDGLRRRASCSLAYINGVFCG